MISETGVTVSLLKSAFRPELLIDYQLVGRSHVFQDSGDLRRFAGRFTELELDHRVALIMRVMLPRYSPSLAAFAAESVEVIPQTVLTELETLAHLPPPRCEPTPKKRRVAQPVERIWNRGPSGC